jgi:uncharacterized protein YigA (DUF484 family)
MTTSSELASINELAKRQQDIIRNRGNELADANTLITSLRQENEILKETIRQLEELITEIRL